MHRFLFDRFARFAVVFAVVLTAACADNDLSRPDPDPDPDPVPLPAAVASATVIDTAGSIFRSIAVQLDSASMLDVFYRPIGGGPILRMRSDTMAVKHEMLLPRLRHATDYELAIRTYRDTLTSDSVFRAQFSTDSLPAALQQFDYSVTGESTFPLLVVPFRSTALGWAGQVAIDSDGNIVWYYQSAGGTLVAHPVPGNTNDMVFIENGFPGDAGPNGIVRVSPEREVVEYLPREGGPFGQIHHDVTAVTNRIVLFLAYDTMTVRDTVINGEAVWEWNMRTGTVTKKWSSWDFFDWDTDRAPGSSPQGWLHANSISIGPRGNIVISSRSLSQVFSISADFDSIEYRIGGPGSTVDIAPDDRFVGQHAAWELPGGRLLVFDNRGAGATGSPETSRALELQLEADTAYMVWQYDPTPDITSPLRGGVYRLDNGNTVTIFASMPFTVHETDAAGNILWTFTGDQSFTNTFRVTPWPSIDGEVVVDAMP